MTSETEAAEREAIGNRLSELIGQLQNRLLRFEPYRAKLQLAAREAEGWPLEPTAARDLGAHLERELTAEPDYRVLQLLRSATGELNSGRREQALTAAISPAQVHPTATTPPAPLPADLLPDAAPCAADAPPPSVDLHAVARAAVAAMFGSVQRESSPPSAVSAVAPPKQTELESPAPHCATAIKTGADISLPDAVTPGEPAAAAWPGPAIQLPVSPPLKPVVDHVDAAEADVFASLAKLRAPTTVATPVSPIPAVSPDNTMANVFKAAAATVAAAERISVPAGERTFPPPPPTPPAAAGKIFPRPAEASRVAARVPEPGLADSTEIRFVARPASPVLDAIPRALQTASQPPTPVRSTPASPEIRRPLSPSDWEEASVEIRRPSAKHGQLDDLDTANDTGNGGRAAKELNRFVKALRRT